MRKILIIALSVVVLAVAGFGGYGWWTRRGEPTFSKGGAFGAPSATAAPSAQTKVKDRRDGKRVTKKRQAKVEQAARTVKARPAGRSKTVAVRDPVAGTYTYDGSGHERVQFGAASPCSWDIGTVTVDVRKDGRDHVFDTTYSENRQQRLIKRYEDDAVTASYLGAAVTCLGVRETTEDTYEPDATFLGLPLKVGATWHGVSRTENRREEIRGRIVKREAITVPAGRFEAYKVKTIVKLSDGQSGEARMTNWFAPSLGISVREIAHTEARDGDATFTSDYRIELARAPS